MLSFLLMVFPFHGLYRPKDLNFPVISHTGDDFTDEESRVKVEFKLSRNFSTDLTESTL